MRLRALFVTGVTAVVGLAMLSGSALAADWRVENQAYWIKVNEYTSQDGLVHGNGTHGVFAQTGFQSGADVWYTRPSIEVWDAATGGNKLATVWGVCIDTAEFVDDTRHEATLMRGWASSHVGGQYRFNGTVIDSAAWDRVTYLARVGDWGLTDPTGVNASAFQLATWELLSADGSVSGGDWLSGDFRAANVSGAMLAAANGYVATGWQAPSTWSGSGSWYFYNSGAQDVLIDVPGSPAVPEVPATILGPLGLGLLGLIKIKFKR